MGSAVVGFKIIAGLGLRMPKFNSCDADGSALFCAEVYSTVFFLGSGGDNSFNSL